MEDGSVPEMVCKVPELQDVSCSERAARLEPTSLTLHRTVYDPSFVILIYTCSCLASAGHLLFINITGFSLPSFIAMHIM